MNWFDAHLDLAYLAVCGRDMAAPPDKAGGPDLPGCVTLPSLAAGNVKACLGTVFTEMGGNNAASYQSGDVRGAFRAGWDQIGTYEQWDSAGIAGIGLEYPAPLRVGILVEGADPIERPEELPFWIERGVVAVGLAWANGSRYSGGNGTTDGLTDLGRELIREVDDWKIVHDVSHLSDRAMDEFFGLAQGRVIASHSNCREVVKTTEARAIQRHLTDNAIRQITARQGMIGLNLYSPFLAKGGVRDRRATIAEAIDHVEHICQIAGNRRCVGLGSDMDGGFSAQKLPEGINCPADLPKLADELRRRGWGDQDIHAFAWGNWARFWGMSDPG